MARTAFWSALRLGSCGGKKRLDFKRLEIKEGQHGGERASGGRKGEGEPAGGGVQGCARAYAAYDVFLQRSVRRMKPDAPLPHRAHCIAEHQRNSNKLLRRFDAERARRECHPLVAGHQVLNADLELLADGLQVAGVAQKLFVSGLGARQLLAAAALRECTVGSPVTHPDRSTRVVQALPLQGAQRHGVKHTKKLALSAIFVAQKLSS